MAKICIVRRAFYPAEYHVRRNAETLARSGHNVDLICLKGRGQKFIEVINGVRVYRLPLRTSRLGIIQYALEYILFFLMAFIMGSMLHMQKKYDYFEADSMPDFLIFCGILPKLTGAKLILYLFESMPELWAQKKNLSLGSLPVRLLEFHETISCRFADKVICCHELAKDAITSRGIPATKTISLLNVPDETTFCIDRCKNLAIEEKKDGSIYLVQHGTITEHYGIQHVIEALAHVKGRLSIKYHICGEGEFQPFLENLSHKLNVSDMVKFHGYVSFGELIKILCAADVGIVPMLNEFQSPNKMFELIALGKPVIASDLKTFRQHFSDESIIYFSKGNPLVIADALIKISNLSQKRIQKQVENATKEFNRYRWEIMQKRYLGIYDSLR